MSETIVLFDGHALVHRAFHAIPPLTTSHGELVNAIYGFTSMLFKALTDLRPEYAAVAFDLAEPTFRHREYDAYKAHRPHAPEGLLEQFTRVRQLVTALRLPIYEHPGFEADDVLGTLARQASAACIDVVIVTGDADALQLVDSRVRVMSPVRGFSETIIYDEAAVRQRYGLAPSQIPDFKALKGDPSDNIKGVPGIGEKTAVRLLAPYGSIEQLIERLEELPAKQRTILTEHAEEARLSKKLATIVTDVPVRLDLATSRVGVYERSELVALLRELEFRSLMGKLPPQRQEKAAPAWQMALLSDECNTDVGSGQPPVASPAQTKPNLGDYTIVDSGEALSELARKLEQVEVFAVDVETTSIDAMQAGLVGIALATHPGSGYYIPVGHRRATEQLPVAQVMGVLGTLLENPRLHKCGHNLKYDKIVLHQHGVTLDGLAFDTMLATYLLDPSRRSLSLKDVAWTELRVEMTPITALIGKGKAQITMADVPVEAAVQYAGADADISLRLAKKLEPELREAQLRDLFIDVEMPLVPVLAAMEETGIALDVGFLNGMATELAQRLTALEAGIYEETGHQFNVNSTQQLANVLYQELGLPPARRTKKGQSTDAGSLETLRGAHPIIDLILEHRQLGKLKSTYVDALPSLINPQTGRVHTSFNQAGTSTGRLSSSNPNLQNIPIRTDIGRQVRRAFAAGEPAWVLVGADYSQVELRILAHITQDERLLGAFRADADIHAATAADVFKVPMSQVTSDMRRTAKTINFGVIYGISDYGLSIQLGIPRGDAAQFIASYFNRYPAIQEYVIRTKQKAQEHGYVTTLLGRRRFIPDVFNDNPARRNAAERMAINMPIQGTAADIIKVAMVRLHVELAQKGFRSRMILQVHDELVFESPAEEVSELTSLLHSTMETAMELSVHLKVDVKAGSNWRDLEPLA